MRLDRGTRVAPRGTIVPIVTGYGRVDTSMQGSVGCALLLGMGVSIVCNALCRPLNYDEMFRVGRLNESTRGVIDLPVLSNIAWVRSGWSMWWQAGLR